MPIHHIIDIRHSQLTFRFLLLGSAIRIEDHGFEI